jgi:hypothetical protein
MSMCIDGIDHSDIIRLIYNVDIIEIMLLFIYDCFIIVIIIIIIINN